MADRRDKSDTAAPRKRALVSCDRCKLRRARCIRNNPDEPCADCKMSGVQCESKLPRKQRVYGSVETLSLRYRALESLVKGLFPQENIQDTNTIFKLAAARNIPMPATDDFTPADIFSKDTERSASSPQTQGSGQPVISHAQLLHLPSSQHAGTSIPSASTDPSSSKDNPLNPFADGRQGPRLREELIPTRHGISHYFGPSSSFRLATAIRALTARYKAASGVDFPVSRSSGSSNSEPADRASVTPLGRASTNPSDEEYIVPHSRDSLRPVQEQRGSKRSRSRMEETLEPGGPHISTSDTIARFLPSRTLADALVTAYFDIIQPYFPLFHRSIFQFKLEEVYTHGSESMASYLDKGWLICLALVFSFGCQVLQEHDPEQAEHLHMMYISFAKANVQHLLRTTSMVNIQGFAMLSAYHYRLGEKSTSWMMIGIAARMAITMGMHRDSTNLDFEPIERNLRRQVWWCLYTSERINCSMIGRPSVTDDSEISMRFPDSPLLDQNTMPVEIMGYFFQGARLCHSVRHRAYFDRDRAEERTPTLDIAERLLADCDNFIATFPPNLYADFSPVPSAQKSRILYLHILYYYTRCIVSREFLIQKVERHLCYLENKPPPYLDDPNRLLAISEDCVASAHKALQCTLAGMELGAVFTSWCDWFIIFHSIIAVCADFLARPKDHPDSHKDIERKATVRAILTHVRTVRKLSRTDKTFGRIATQFASITGVIDETVEPPAVLGQLGSPLQERQKTPALDSTMQLRDSSAEQEDWFASATTKLGLDFFDLNQSVGAPPAPGNANANPRGYYVDPASNDVEEWTSRTLRGMHTL